MTTQGTPNPKDGESLYGVLKRLLDTFPEAMAFQVSGDDVELYEAFKEKLLIRLEGVPEKTFPFKLAEILAEKPKSGESNLEAMMRSVLFKALTDRDFLKSPEEPDPEGNGRFEAETP
jgi:hypothetical protein